MCRTGLSGPSKYPHCHVLTHTRNFRFVLKKVHTKKRRKSLLFNKKPEFFKAKFLTTTIFFVETFCFSKPCKTFSMCSILTMWVLERSVQTCSTRWSNIYDRTTHQSKNIPPQKKSKKALLKNSSKIIVLDFFF